MRPAITDSLKRVGIIGGGLIGGSLAEATRRHFPHAELALADISAATRSAARASGLFDGGVYAEPASVIDETAPNLIIIAAPLLSYEKILYSLRGTLHNTGSADIYLTDAGSVKHFIRERFRSHLPQMLGNIIGAHPIAGSERGGFANRDPMLFENTRTILCPGYSVHARALSVVRGYWRRISGETVNLRCEKHDMIYAAVSHLPQLIAFGLAQLAREKNGGAAQHMNKDRAYTRLFDSSLPLWYETFFCNASALRSVFDAYAQALRHAAQAAGKFPPVYAGDVRETMLAAPVVRRLRSPAPGGAREAFGAVSAFEYAVTASVIHIGMFYRDFGGPAFADYAVAANAGLQHGIRSSDTALLRDNIEKLIVKCETILKASDNKQAALIF